jgi:hypothetical protein
MTPRFIESNFIQDLIKKGISYSIVKPRKGAFVLSKVHCRSKSLFAGIIRYASSIWGMKQMSCRG